MTIREEIQFIKAAGTSEGAKKAWESRERGKATTPAGPGFTQALPREHNALTEQGFEYRGTHTIGGGNPFKGNRDLVSIYYGPHVQQLPPSNMPVVKEEHRYVHPDGRTATVTNTGIKMTYPTEHTIPNYGTSWGKLKY